MFSCNPVDEQLHQCAKTNGPLSPTPAHPHVPHIFTPPPNGFPRRVLVVQVVKGDNYLCRMRMAAACDNLIALQTRLVHTVCASDRTVWVHWAKPLQHLWHTPCKHYACASRFWSGFAQCTHAVLSVAQTVCPALSEGQPGSHTLLPSSSDSLFRPAQMVTLPRLCY